MNYRSKHDVKIYINEKLIHDLKDEGIPSGQLKVVGTNMIIIQKQMEQVGKKGRLY